MEIRANFIMIGLFSILSLCGILAAILWLSKGIGQEHTDRYKIEFREGVNGLSVGNAVLFSGIRVGFVESVTISDTIPGAVAVIIAIRGDTPVRGDSEAKLELQGLTGSSAVAITGGTTKSPLVHIQENQIGNIKSSTSSLSAVLRDAPGVAQQIKSSLSRVEDLLSDKNINSVEQILTNVDAITANIANNKEHITAILQHGESSLKNLDSLIATTARTAASINSAVASLGPELQRTSKDTLPQIRMLVADTKNLIIMLTRITRKLDNDPRQFIFGNNIKEIQPQ